MGGFIDKTVLHFLVLPKHEALYSAKSSPVRATMLATQAANTGGGVLHIYLTIGVVPRSTKVPERVIERVVEK
jgi:hypothetical protein